MLMRKRNIYELDSATVAEMLGDGNILFVFPEGGSFPYPDMAGDLDYYGSPVWIPGERDPHNMEMWGGKYLGFYTTEKNEHVEAWVFKQRSKMLKAVVKFRKVRWRGTDEQIEQRYQDTLSKLNDPERRKQLRVDMYKSRLYDLVKMYPEGYFSGAFLGWMDVLSDYTYREWKRDGLSDEEFEDSFGGGSDYDLIHEWWRPTFDNSEGQEENYPPIGVFKRPK